MKKLFIVLIAFSLVSCSDINSDKILIGSWRLHDVTTESGKSDFDVEAASMQLVSDGAILNMFSDGIYSYMSGGGDYKTGKWNSEGKQLVFRPSIISSDLKFNISVTSGKMKELDLINANTGVVFKYSKEAEPLEVIADDPFHPANNLWRIKATAPESKEKLKERLANYFKHFALILKAARDRKQEVVYFNFSQGPIRVYNGGIGILPVNNLPVVWKRTFYDDADATTAYYLYEKVLSEQAYHGASVGNWVEDDYKIVQAVYHAIKQMKVED